MYAPMYLAKDTDIDRNCPCGDKWSLPRGQITIGKYTGISQVLPQHAQSYYVQFYEHSLTPAVQLFRSYYYGELKAVMAGIVFCKVR